MLSDVRKTDCLMGQRRLQSEGYLAKECTDVMAKRAGPETAPPMLTKSFLCHVGLSAISRLVAWHKHGCLSVVVS